MNLLNRRENIGKSLIYFLIFFFLYSGFLYGEEDVIQEYICVNNTVTMIAEKICFEDKSSIDKVAVCSLYTSTPVAEILCLKNVELSYKTILDCFINTDYLMEQICLIGSESSSRIINQSDSTNVDLEIIKEIENFQKEINSILDRYLDGQKVRFDLSEGGFVLDVDENKRRKL